MTEWYRTPGLAQARERAEVHMGLLGDMQRLRSAVRWDDTVTWVAPSYVPLVADRRAIPAPDSRLSPQRYREGVDAAGPHYVFLSAYHPRETLSDAAWRSGMKALAENGYVVYARASRETGRPRSFSGCRGTSG